MEKIVDEKEEILPDGKKRILYFVKWEGYSDDKNTWEPEANLIIG
jgi:hypothetical protein